MKRSKCCRSIWQAGIFCFIMMLGCLLYMPATEASYFNPLGKGTFLYLDTREVNLNAEGERVSFVMQRDGVLRMYSRDGMHDYLSFTGYYGSNSGIGYKIRKIEVRDPDKVLFEINADQGAHAKNAGYWIVGKYKGKWVTFVSLDTLAQYGYTVGEWHALSTDVDSFGNLILTSVHEYMPAGAQYGYQMKRAVDFRAQLFWDANAQWFGIKRIQ